MSLDDKELAVWPGDWPIHIIRGFKSYFSLNSESSSIVFVSAIPLSRMVITPNNIIDGSEVKATFSLKSRIYAVSIKLCDEYVSADLKFVLDYVESEKFSSIEGYPKGKAYKMITTDICVICEKDVLTLAKKLEEEIWKDYWRREGGGEQDSQPRVPSDSNLVPA